MRGRRGRLRTEVVAAICIAAQGLTAGRPGHYYHRLSRCVDQAQVAGKWDSSVSPGSARARMNFLCRSISSQRSISAKRCFATGEVPAWRLGRETFPLDPRLGSGDIGARIDLITHSFDKMPCGLVTPHKIPTTSQTAPSAKPARSVTERVMPRTRQWLSSRSLH